MNSRSPDYTNRSSQSETRILARRGVRPARRPADREQNSSAWTAHSGSDPAAGQTSTGVRDPAEFLAEPELADPPRQVIQRKP